MIRHAEKPTRSARARIPVWVLVLLFALMLSIGFILSNEISRIRVENLELAEIRRDYNLYANMLQEQTERNERLESTAASLSEELFLEYDRILEESGQQGLLDQWRTARALAGFTDVTGQGIVITLDDMQSSELMSKETVIHDQDVQYVVDSLKFLGASAISINGERIVGTSQLTCNGPTILINRTFCPVPYIISAVGDSDAMYQFLLEDTYLLGREADGIQIDLVKSSELTILAFLDLQTIGSQIDLLEVVGS